MQDDKVSPGVVFAVFAGLVLLAALAIGLVVLLTGPNSSSRRSAAPSAHALSSRTPHSISASHVSPSPAPAKGQVDWTHAVTSVGVVLNDGTNLVAVLTEPTPSEAGFEGACSKLAQQTVSNPPLGSGGAQLSSLQAVISDDAALVHACQTTIAEARARISSTTAFADGETIGRDLVTLRYDAANFYLAIGDSVETRLRTPPLCRNGQSPVRSASKSWTSPPAPSASPMLPAAQTTQLRCPNRRHVRRCTVNPSWPTTTPKLMTPVGSETTLSTRRS